MRIDVLGTVAVSGASGSVSGALLGGRRAQIVLAALAVERTTIPSERLASMIWGEQPPPTWPAALRGVIRGLRTVLEPIGGGDQHVIVTEARGYRLAPAVEVDVLAAEQAVARATELSRRGRHRAALDVVEPCARLVGADLLRGEDGEWVRPYRASVDVIARRALDIIVEVASDAGDPQAAVDAARRRVAADPLDESAHRNLIRAFDGNGDRGGAVRAFEECRSVLAEQLGVDPSAETVQVYLATLHDQAPSRPASIPLAATSFVGRESEASELRAALTKPGLLTVTGRGGVGKSRLVARVAAAERGFSGGHLWVSLGSVTEDGLVAVTVALTLGVAIGADDATHTLADHLSSLGPTLLVLDGAEIVRDGVASLVAVLVAQCPLLSVVVTSRVPLGLDGEAVHPLGPLDGSVPGPTGGDRANGDPDALLVSPLVRLLTDRVREGGGELTIDSESEADVRALLARCDGLPLAVELVAAQLAAIPIGDLLDQFAEPGDDDPLRAIARSSYALLDEQEAAVFRRCAVLDGSVGLSLIRSVVSDESIAPVRVVRILRELTASGLLNVDRSGPRWRYHQDDDLHRFAGELLAEHDEERASFARLADYIRALLPEDARDPPAAYSAAITDILASVRSLFAAAVAGRADADRGLELAFRLHRYWAASNVAEGRFWLAHLLDGRAESTWVPYATYALGYLDYWSGDTGNAVRELEGAVALFDGAPDPYAARALIYLAGLLDDLDRGSEAVEYVRRAIAAATPHGIDLKVGAAMGLGSVLSERGDPEAAVHAADAVELCRSAGSPEQLAVALPTAAMVCWQVGAAEQARAFADEARPLHAQGKRIARVVLLSVDAGLCLDDGDYTAAVEIGTVADQEGTELGVEREMPLIRSVLARAHLAAGDIGAAVDRTVSAIQAARGMAFDYPLAIGLETACWVLLDPLGGGLASAADLAPLLATAGTIRRRGDRPPPATLAEQINSLSVDDSAAELTPADAAERAIDLLARIGPR